MKVNKDGTAHWDQGSIVEVSIHAEDHDPNLYYAKCLTSGTFPDVQVLDAKYPIPFEGKMQDCLYSIWRELSEVEAKAVFPRGEEAVSTGTYVVKPQWGGCTEVIDTRSNTVVEEFSTCDVAVAWIERHECPACGLPVTGSAKGCSKPHFSDEEPIFTAF